IWSICLERSSQYVALGGGGSGGTDEVGGAGCIDAEEQSSAGWSGFAAIPKTAVPAGAPVQSPPFPFGGAASLTGVVCGAGGFGLKTNWSKATREFGGMENLLPFGSVMTAPLLPVMAMARLSIGTWPACCAVSFRPSAVTT